MSDSKNNWMFNPKIRRVPNFDSISSPNEICYQNLNWFIASIGNSFQDLWSFNLQMQSSFSSVFNWILIYPLCWPLVAAYQCSRCLVPVKGKVSAASLLGRPAEEIVIYVAYECIHVSCQVLNKSINLSLSILCPKLSSPVQPNNGKGSSASLIKGFVKEWKLKT